MLAARLHGRHDMRVEQIPEPSDLRPDEIRVRPRLCGICGSDLHEYESGGMFIHKEDMPQVMGHEFSADVLEVGADVTSVRVGDRCAVLPHVFCGHCHFCVRGRQGLCRSLRVTGMTWPWGGLAQEAVVPGYQAVPLPDAVSYEQGAILEPLATVVYAAQRAGLRLGDRVLIAGAGPVGQLAVLVAAAAGASAIYISEPHAGRRRQAEGLGVSGAFDPTVRDVAGELLELTDGLGVDISIECSGSQRALEACVSAVRAGGTIAQTALHVGPRTVIPEDWTMRDLTICGTWSFNYYDTPRILDQIASGRLPVERIVTSQIALEDIVEQGIEALGDPAGDQTKVLVGSSA
ncbi:MAG: (R,R)-butanediol dehydrogenase / meso-butanediol dehydrogenase / diacetyl reductase [Gaiellales bacterium]|jgi:(R,R)-butanediol dehydrogenase/meso-butanediol dehydrogenase/diacetyl reductase|nr:(R,R)-butanediol dehydrogenase / meso-butanediol dehydrogenase / diacetyl reductase [Gaiellales bacterium]